MTPTKTKPSNSDLESINQRLLKEIEERDATLAVLNSVQEGLASNLELEAIFELVGERITEIFPGQGVALYTLDTTSNTAQARFILERGVRHYPPPFAPGPIGQKAAKTKKAFMLSTQAEFDAIGTMTVEGTEASLSGIFAPLLVHDTMVGALNIESLEKEHAFTGVDLDLVTTIASSLSVALENVRLFNETEERNAELAIINTVQRALAAQLDIQGIYEAVGEKLREIFDSQTIAIYSADLKGRIITTEYAFEKGQRFEPLSQPFSGLHAHLVGLKGTYVFNGNFPEFAAQFEDYRVTTGEMPKSLVGVPVLRQQDTDTIVTLTLQDIDGEKTFSNSDVRLLETLANSMAVALENARLFDKVQKSNREITEALEQQTATSDILHVMASSPTEIQPVLVAVAENAAKLFDAIDVQIYRVDGDRLRAVTHFGPSPSLEDGETLPLVPGLLTGRAVLERKTIHIHDLLEISESEYPESVKYRDRFESTRSVIVTPLLREGEAIGAVVVRRNEVRPFSEKHIALLTTFADQASIAIENVRLFNETSRLLNETEQRAAELQIINSVQEGLASKLDIQSIIELVGNTLGEIFEDVDVLQINLYDEARNYIHIPYCLEKGLRHEHEARQPWGFRKHVIESRQPVIINENLNEIAKEYGNPVIAGEEPKSVVYVPLITADHVRGILSLQNMRRENAFPESTVQLLMTLANSMSVALENARLFDETQRLLKETEQRAAEFATINNVSKALIAESNLEALIELIGEQMRLAFSADIVYVALLEGQTNMIRFPYTYGEEFETLPLGEGLTGRIIQTGEPLLINREMDKRRAEMGVTRVGKSARSYLGVPIKLGGRTFGVISVQSTQDEGLFTEDDLRLLNTIAANVSTAIRNAQLFDEIKNQKQYYETVIENSPAAIVLLDHEARITGWNPAAEELFGYTEAEALGENIDDLVAKTDDMYAEAVRYSQKALDEKQVHLLARRTRKDGSLVDVEVSGVPIAIEGQQADFIAIYHDVTELQSARQAAEDANQAKSTFLANMSHELRTPLNAILGFTRIVRRKGVEVLPEKQVENLDKVLISADHLLGLINTVLDISKIEAGRMDVKPAAFELPSLVNLVVDTSQPLMQEDVNLEADVPSQFPLLYTDQDKLKQILINLLSNAAKFTHEGSIILAAREDGEMLYVDVSDTGIGISEDALARIFEEFQQADTSTTREYGGTGLGLSISRRLARLLGGDLTACSIEGEGSTFTLTMPLRFEVVLSDEQPAPVNQEQVHTPTGQPIILSIDDDQNVHDLLKENLGERGYQVIAACSGDEGIRLARQLEPFAITLDIMMPGKDGWQVLHELKADPTTREIPVILITIMDKQSLGYQLGAADYLVKPLEEDAVLAALQHIRAHSRGGSHVHVLVIDDDPNIPEMVGQLLEAAAYKIEAAADGMSALEAIRNQPPDVILLDLMMPNMDGFELIESMRAADLRIPIIVLSAKTPTAAELEILEGSVEQIIQKNGLDQEQLLDELQATMESLREQAVES